MNLKRDNIDKILVGSSVLGCGGGGSYKFSEAIVEKITHEISLKSISEMDDGLIITFYAVGGIRIRKGDAESTAERAIKLLQSKLKGQIKYLIPVEIGPFSLISLLYLASQLNLPVVDGDIVGYRSSPEVYLETITLKNISRLPITAANSEGAFLSIDTSDSAERVEELLRDFSSNSKSQVYVSGYPMCKVQIEGVIGEGSVTFSYRVGKTLLESTEEDILIKDLCDLGFVFIAKGKIVSQKTIERNGFTFGELQIKSRKGNYSLVYKNEYIALLEEGKVILTCPDLICLIDVEKRRGIDNSIDNAGRDVLILARKAIPIWRTAEGKQLFSPRKLGLDFDQKLL